MTVSFFHSSIAELSNDRAFEGGPDDLLGMLGPVMAGSRARGVADAFDLLGMAAVLIDKTGQVLHSGRRAEAMLNPMVRIVGHHLIGFDARTKDVIENFVSQAVGPDKSETLVAELDTLDGRRLRLRALRFPAAEPAAVQLLHTVMVVEPVAE